MRRNCLAPRRRRWLRHRRRRDANDLEPLAPRSEARAAHRPRVGRVERLRMGSVKPPEARQRQVS
jgi:hypothetical protein